MKTEVQSKTMAHGEEVAAGERFEFGANWSRFLQELDDNRIKKAEESLQNMLGMSSLAGKNFIDVGSGSGLFSLVARRLGAKVFSFDYDPKSVACTRELQRRFYPGDPNWTVEEGSALDPAYLSSLGQFDIVYSWGVLHHTGQMWPALTNVERLVKSGGTLYIAIYNDQGTPSRRWTMVKQLYNRFPPSLRFLVLWPSFLQLWGRTIVKDLVMGRGFKTWKEYNKLRGMSPWWDVIDWVGGYPFEVAKPEDIFDFYHQKGYQLEKMHTEAGSLGCNEFVFNRQA